MERKLKWNYPENKEDQQNYQKQYKIMYSCNSCRVQSPSILLSIYWEPTMYPALYLLPGTQQYVKQVPAFMQLTLQSGDNKKH